jgi:hypothetical protein
LKIQIFCENSQYGFFDENSLAFLFFVTKYLHHQFFLKGERKGSENAYISQMDIRCVVHADAVTHRIHNAANQALLGSVGDCNLAPFSSEDAVRKNSRRLACNWNTRENF